MENFLYFSRYIQLVKEKIIFFFIVFTRALRLLFTSSQSIECIYLDFAPKHHFTSSYLIIRYQFRNALWYHFKGFKKTTDNEVVVFNLKAISAAPIELVVHGLFRRKTFILNVTPESTLINTTFKTAVTRLRDIDLKRNRLQLQNIKPLLIDKKPALINKKPSLVNKEIKLTPGTIKIEYPSFNQTDYL